MYEREQKAEDELQRELLNEESKDFLLDSDDDSNLMRIYGKEGRHLLQGPDLLLTSDGEDHTEPYF